MFDYYLTADDVLANSVDNMSDEEIDRDVKLFRRIAQKLGIRNYNDLIVVPGEDDYNPDYYDQPLGIFSTNLYKNNDSIKVCSVDGIDFVAEELNGTLYLYFKDETTASKYKDMIDEFNNGYSEDVNESLNESGYENVILDLESIEKFLSNNNFYSYDVYNYDKFPMDTSKIDFEVKGDWKHEHLFFKSLINEWAEQNNRKIFKIDSHEVGESDSDYYTAIYSVYITKDDDSFDKLNSMRGLFAESLDASSYMNLNESLSQYYKIGDKGNELIYTISSLRYSGESESSDPYAVVYMTLVCGWDYCSDWSDKMGWVDPENWVEDVQTDYFIVYLSDETIEQALADNGYTPTSKPSPIYHYNEEKDSWEVLKESLSIDKYIRKSLNELDNKAINEDTKFYDLRSLYEAFSNKLTQEQKQELKKVIDSTDDAEIIAAAIGTKTKNEAFDIDTGSEDIFGDEPDNNYSVSAFLTRKGYHNYVGLYEDLWTDDLSEAEAFIWDSLQNGLYVEFNDYTTLATKGYADTKYYSPDELDETTVDYTELEECASLNEAEIIEPKYKNGDLVFIGDASGYQGTFLINGDFRNIPKELYDNIHRIYKYGDDDKPYYKVEFKLSSDHVFRYDYDKFYDYMIPLLHDAGISIIDDFS